MRYCLLLLISIFWSIPVIGQVINTNEVQDHPHGLELNAQLRVYEDQTKTWELEDLLKQQEVFEALQSFTPKNSKSHYWLKCQLSNQQNIPFEALLKFVYLSHVTAYIVHEGQVIETGYGGEYSKAKNRRMKDGRLYIRFDIPSKTTVDIYLKVRQRKGFLPQFQFELYPEEYYHVLTKHKPFKEALVFGAFAIFVIYGLLIFIKNKHKPYLWLSLTVLFKGLFFIQMLGYFTDLFIPNHPKAAMDMLVLLMYGSGITGILLIRDFLKLKVDYPIYYKGFNGFAIFLGFQAIIIFYIKFTYDNFLLGNSIGFASYIPQGIFVVYVLIKLIPKIPKFKRPVIIGSCLYAGITLFTSVNFLFNLEQSYGNYTWNEIIGSLAFLFLFFYTLGQEMELNIVEKNKALRRINTMIERQKDELNKLVKERTFELERSKEEIESQNSVLSKRNSQIEVLLKEVHHRVKNNLQIISSLLNLQTKSTEDETALAAMTDGQNRVKAMALIHQGLYQHENMATIKFQDYAEQLLTQLASIYPKGPDIQRTVKASGIELDIDTAVPLGLILNELITNSYKYAFNDALHGKIEVELQKKKKSFELTVKDNGVGLAENFEWKKAKSIGLRLVRRLSKQLYGDFSYEFQNGATFNVKFQDTFTRKQVS